MENEPFNDNMTAFAVNRIHWFIKNISKQHGSDKTHFYDILIRQHLKIYG